MDKPMYKLFLALLLLLTLGLDQPASALNSIALEQEMNSAGKITIIDIRPNALYRKNHIQGAINIPASIVTRKRLPPLGRVIVYDEGLDVSLLEQAVSALNAKPGIQAEALEGGFAAWSARHNVVQRNKGISASQIRNLTYQELQKMSQRTDTLILVDLRMGEVQESLAEHFPDVRVYDPIDGTSTDTLHPEVSQYIMQTIPKQNLDVLILIDDGNGFAERISDKLHAASIKRLAILAGGEQALRTRGVIGASVSRTGE